MEIVGLDALDFDRQFGIAGRLRDEAQNTDQIAEVMAWSRSCENGAI